MPAIAPSYSPGQEVEIGKIDRELKKLWELKDSAKSRASLVNLAVYSEATGSLGDNTQLVAQITENLACRAIVLEANRAAKENRAQAWISAHCHVSRAGSKQICSEQLSFLLEGPCTNLLHSIVFSHLDSDLPFYLWWQGEFYHPMDHHLWAWVDRVIYDSQVWHDFDAQMKLVETAQREASQRIVLCDLNWTRLDRIRIALAQFFDHPAAHHHFDKIEHVGIVFAPGYRSTAVLLAGWLAAQLKWRLESIQKPDEFCFMDARNRKIKAELKEQPGKPIGQVQLRSSVTTFSVQHAPDADLLEVSRDDSGETRMRQLMPAGSNDLVRLMSDELIRGGPHAIYLRVIDCIRKLL